MNQRAVWVQQCMVDPNRDSQLGGLSAVRMKFRSVFRHCGVSPTTVRDWKMREHGPEEIIDKLFLDSVDYVGHNSKFIY